MVGGGDVVIVMVWRWLVWVMMFVFCVCCLVLRTSCGMFCLVSWRDRYSFFSMLIVLISIGWLVL